MGILLSLVQRRRWLSLAGIALCCAAVPAGYMTRNGMLLVTMIALGGLLMFGQIAVTLRKIRGATREEHLPPP